MPHVVMEYAAPVARKTDVRRLLEDIHAAVRASGLFDPGAIKGRGIAYGHDTVGDSGQTPDFVHVSVWILSGRSVARRQSLGQAVLDVMTSALSGVESLTVDIREMDRAAYAKRSG